MGGLRGGMDQDYDYEQVEHLYDNADIIIRREQQLQQSTMLVMDPFEDEKHDIDISNEEKCVRRESFARPVANGWAWWYHASPDNEIRVRACI